MIEDFEDGIFVDYFNTFIHLPVFGQTPLYTTSPENRWHFCPAIPEGKRLQKDGFHLWMKNHRFPYFQQTELYQQYLLCKELLLDPPSWREQFSVADRGLLNLCLGSVQGMRCFSSFLKGQQGRLLDIDLQKPGQRTQYQAIYAVIKAFHFRDGSAIMTNCRLSHEYEDFASSVLFYPTKPRLTPDPRGWQLGPKDTEGEQMVYETYSSKLNKVKLFGRNQIQPDTALSAEWPEKPGPLVWFSSVDDDADDSECSNVVHRSKTVETFAGDVHAEGASLELSGSKLPPIFNAGGPGKEAPLNPCIKTPLALACYNHLSIGLSADVLAGRPYEDFLRVQGQDVILHHLGLWQELDNLLNLLLMGETDSPSLALRQTLAKRIVMVYLLPDSPQWRSLSKKTAKHLTKCLPTGDVMTWTNTAKQELCQILAPSYYSFLEEEDKCFLTYLFNSPKVTGTVRVECTGGLDAPFQQVRRIQEALRLSQTYCGHTTVEPLNEKPSFLLSLVDVRRGGSIQPHLKKSNESENAKKDLEEQAKKDLEEQAKKDLEEQAKKDLEVKEQEAWDQRLKLYAQQRCVAAMPDPATIQTVKPAPDRPRVTEYQKTFPETKESTDAVKPAAGIEEEHKQSNKVSGLIRRVCIFSVSMKNKETRRDFEDYLDCQWADYSTECKPISPKTWPCTPVNPNTQPCTPVNPKTQPCTPVNPKTQPCTPVNPKTQPCTPVNPKTQPCKAVNPKTQPCKAVNPKTQPCKPINPKTLPCKPVNPKSQPCIPVNPKIQPCKPVNPKTQPCKPVNLKTQPCKPVNPKTRPCMDGRDSRGLRWRLVNNKPVAVNLLHNDLFFYLETNKFRQLADFVNRMESEGMLGENVMLQHKANAIVESIFWEEMDTKLRINISEDMWLSIKCSLLAGKVDRSFFSDARLAVLPVLLFCWKRFCHHMLREGDLNDEDEEEAVVPDDSNIQPTTSEDVAGMLVY
ncbi:hypothetical protein NHX12_004660 [Muraenolepis orangiensis]|uniref:Uncharacterized protein n=1 Tax=Muraenolepis orangiensis TaxID=630683 RepID=A0A9Q0DVM6_9TELE|nr:hypothetical protein NHX12_004660 [Muraenolepis orangiensis]